MDSVNDSLIDKLEGLKLKSEKPSYTVYSIRNAAIDDCIAIIRQHTEAQGDDTNSPVCKASPEQMIQTSDSRSEIPVLKPCPFCGGDAQLWEGDWAVSDHGVSCVNTQCQTTHDPCRLPRVEGETSEQYAARVWNTRTPEPVSIEDIAAKLWRRDYPLGGSGYKTYESTHEYDKDLYRKEIKFVLDAARLSYVD